MYEGLTRYLGTSILEVSQEIKMSAQSPIKVNEATKTRVRYLAALEDATQTEIVDRAIAEYAVRHADVINKGLDRAREVLVGGDTAVAAHLLGLPLEAVERVAGRS
jgi:hypothetical protein